MMSRIDEFIAHGLLPFVGREKELEKITAFWRSIPEAQRLRAMLLTAEAGIGKSRLLEESLQVLGRDRGAVVHAKLYPETTNAPAALLSRSLWKSTPARSILRTQPGENLPEVIAALQRLSRLRPTLVILEDIHLFSSESIPDLARLFDALADETISILCLSRPVALPSQGVLEAYLIESVRMDGITPEAVAELWRELFGASPSDDVVHRLHSTTKGNMLAIRSGLRWGIQSGTIAPVGTNGVWKTTGTAAMFEQGLRRSVSLVAEGMVAHLKREEREGAQILGTLGEVFARETAGALLPDSGRLLAELTAQGIIVETFHPVSPLPSVPLTEPGKGWQVDYPASTTSLLAFTHSLLHDHLADRAEVRTSSLLTLVSNDAPLYSLLPFRLLEKEEIPKETDPNVLIRVIRRLSAIAIALDQSAHWKNAAELLKLMYRLLEHVEEKTDLSPQGKLLWRMNGQHIHLSILRRSMGTPEWIATHERQLKITESPETLLAAQYRLLAHTYVLDRISVDKSYEEGLKILGDLDDLLNRFAELRTDISYVYILESLLHHAFAYGDTETIRDVQKRTALLLADPNLHGKVRHAVSVRILAPLLTFYSTPEELRDREESIPVIEEYQPETDPFYGTSKIKFLAVSGRFAQALHLVGPVAHRAAERGLWLNVFIIWNWQVVCAVGVGYSFGEATRTAKELLPTMAEEQLKSAENYTGAFALAGILSGRPEEGRAQLESFGFTAKDIPEAFRAIMELGQGNLQVLREMEFPMHTGKFTLEPQVLRIWQGIAEAFGREAPPSPDDVTQELIRLLEAPVVQIYDLLTVHGTLPLWKALTQTPPPDVLRQALARQTTQGLEWLTEREIPAFTPPLILLLGELDYPAEAKEWEGKIRTSTNVELPLAVSTSVPQAEEHTIRISMLGTIGAALPGEELAPIRGVRIRTLLGLMVADRMIGTPLSQEEFLTLAGGEESDPEHARKKKNMGVVRLREIIGHDAIRTDGPTPQLHTALVRVDLLEVDELVRRALEAARAEAFVRALPLIEEAVERYGGDVPFPTLYDNFFEAAREDFEGRMRQAVLEIGGGMLRMGDAAGAEPFLRNAFDALPGDDEIGELLRQALENSGNRIEAERVRMKMEGMK